MHLRKKNTQEIFFQVTLELQYANKIDSVPSQSYILFWLHNTLKKGVENKHMVLSLLIPGDDLPYYS